ncbi:MAG: hypothetical protein M3Y57_03075 [Acidobacteriota bacterium]|nr:hypothetical protein [Acidobacteriota bacterium]
MNSPGKFSTKMAWTYLIGMAMWGFLFGLTGVGGWQLPGSRWFGLAWVLLLEPIRGIVLYKFARRYIDEQ